MRGMRPGNAVMVRGAAGSAKLKKQAKLIFSNMLGRIVLTAGMQPLKAPRTGPAAFNPRLTLYRAEHGKRFSLLLPHACSATRVH